MPRQVSDQPIMTRAARERLPARKEPYWRRIDAGVSLGFRKGTSAANWVVRISVDGRYREVAIGRADDDIKADGVLFLDFRQAEVKARAEAAIQYHISVGLDAKRDSRAPYTVAQAMEDYLTSYKRRGGKSVGGFNNTANAHILPALGSVRVDRLTRNRIIDWRDAIAAAPPRLRSKKSAKNVPRFRAVDPSDTDALRRRRATTNRVLTILKAALNHAYNSGRIHSKLAWDTVKPFRDVNLPRIRHLTDDEVVRLVNACAMDLRQVVIAATVTGMRYGEVCQLRACDFERDSKTILVAYSKSGKPRHIYLSQEGVQFFEQASAGKDGWDPMFTRSNDEPWGKSHQFRPLREACVAARIEPVISIHILRHTYARRLALAGAPLMAIAAQLGHGDYRMTERHYAHLTPNYVADVVRASFGAFGIVPSTNVVPMGHLLKTTQ
jgi:integrase